MVKILLIGYGYWGKIWYKTIKASQYELVAIVDPIFNSRRELVDMTIVTYEKLEDVKKEFTHAIIATPVSEHLNTYRKLKELFKLPDENILIEKPVGLNLEQAKIMKNCCHDLVWLYDPTFIELKKQINKIGKINLVQMTRASMGPRLRTDVSILEDYLFHDIYLYLDLFKPVNNNINLEYFSLDKINIRDYDSLIKQDTIIIKAYDISNDIHLQMFSSWVYPKKERKTVIIGNKGSLIWENDSIFINNSYFEKLDNFTKDELGNIGYKLNILPETVINSSNHLKSNLNRLLTTFIYNQFTNIENDLVIKTHNFIENIITRS